MKVANRQEDFDSKIMTDRSPPPTGAGRNPRAEVTRRSFLNTAWKGFVSLTALLGLGGLVRFLGFQTEPASPDRFDLGPAGDYPPGTRTPIPQARAILIHAEGGFSAMSTVCPHLGCLVSAQEQGYACPCHGSQFDLDGRLQRGPAAQSLTHLEVEVNQDGRVILYSQSH